MREPITAPRTIRLMTALLLVGTFALGTVTGTGLAYWTAGAFRPPPPPPGPLPFRLLELSPTQSEQAHAILERHRPELDAILRESFPKVRAVNERIEREIAPILSPAQRARLAELERRRPLPPSMGMPPFPLAPGGRAPGGPPPPGWPPSPPEGPGSELPPEPQ